MPGAVKPTALVILYGQLAGKGFLDDHAKMAALYCKRCTHKPPYHEQCRRYIWTWSHKVDSPWCHGRRRKRSNLTMIAIGPLAAPFFALPPGTSVKVKGHLGGNGVWVDEWCECSEDMARQELACLID